MYEVGQTGQTGQTSTRVFTPDTLNEKWIITKFLEIVQEYEIIKHQYYQVRRTVGFFYISLALNVFFLVKFITKK